MKHIFAALLAGMVAAASAQTDQQGMAAIAGLVQALAGTNSQNAQVALPNAPSAAQNYTNGGISVGPNNPAGNQSPVAAIAGLVQAFAGTNAGAQDGKSALAAAAGIVQGLAGANTNPLASLGGKSAADFRELKKALPETLAGLRRTNARGEKAGAFGAEVSYAEGTYETEGQRLVIKVSDLGALGPVAALAGMAWAARDVDSEGDSGYERTVQYRGHKGLEKYSSATKSGTANVAVANRFMIEITGRGIEASQLKSAAEGLDYAALEKLANP